jgi:2-dehydro-3-deoxyphosphooctonate aldolase (KDO 8-P synthase)
MRLCGFEAGLAHPLFLIAGPCVIESEQLQMDTAGTLRDIAVELGMPFIFKSSFDKANRSSGSSYRGPASTWAWRSWPRCATRWACRY